MRKYKCSTCQKLIRDNMGFVEVSIAEVNKYKAEKAKFGTAEPIKWYAVHTHCEASGSAFYSIPVWDLRFPNGVIEATARLLEHYDWICDTNWKEILSDFADSHTNATFYQERES
jgi:hypothetical protein